MKARAASSRAAAPKLKPAMALDIDMMLNSARQASEGRSGAPGALGVAERWGERAFDMEIR